MHGLARDIRTLTAWLSHDILALAGPSLINRRDLFNFIIAELGRREHENPHRIGSVRIALRNQRDDLLAFAVMFDDKLNAIGQAHELPQTEYIARVLTRMEPAARQDRKQVQRRF